MTVTVERAWEAEGLGYSLKNTQPAIGAKMSAKALEYLKNNEEVTRVTGVECAGRNGRGA